MIENIAKRIKGKKILILGFGLEGKSTYTVLKEIVPSGLLTIADQNPIAFDGYEKIIDCRILSGEQYLDNLSSFDLIIKTPGLPKAILKDKVDPYKVTSQTDLFLSVFSSQTIGVTGTKGKSTTSSLIRHIIASHTNNTLLVGNIGLPPFDFIQKIDGNTHLVFELSSHQLDDITTSPHISIILNIFQEHLDHYHHFDTYKNAKLNIANFQNDNDWLILNHENDLLVKEFYPLMRQGLLWFSNYERMKNGAFKIGPSHIRTVIKGTTTDFDFSKRAALPGDHNMLNIMAAICAAQLIGVPEKIIHSSVMSFSGLEHRLEYVGLIGGIQFYNDSISTIPEATLAALKTLQNVDTLILGGKDRGIDYSHLIEYLPRTSVKNLIFMGEAGKRIHDGLIPGSGQNTFVIDHFEEIEKIIRENTLPGSICLLSPAASSYDMFRNFEERGKLFKKIAGNFKFPAVF